IKNHAQFGFDILRSDQQFSLLSAHIALQHHELGDGKGYPRGISGKEIHPYARIVTVADVFDALVADRPYRKAYSTDQAIAIMKQRSGASFEPAYLEALFSNIAQFPIGSVVALNTQEIAIIVDNNRETPTRPVVRVIIDRHNRELNKPLEIDLTKDHLVEISRVLSEEEISILLKELSEPRIRDTM
ncbi:MAG: HD domain-containing protein, partial [Syntrophomonadaceae bacterium]|nr:HD domain-containing protein [Syntrophomonadaceae bacterium]